MNPVRNNLKRRLKWDSIGQCNKHYRTPIRCISTNVYSTGETSSSSLPISTLRQSTSNDGKRYQPGFFTPSQIKDESFSSNTPPNPPSSNRISDHEFEVRIGRAFDLLRATLPDFMRIGLVDYDNYSSSSTTDNEKRSSSTSMSLLDALTFRSLRAKAAEEGLLGGAFGSMGKEGDEISLSKNGKNPSIFPQNHFSKDEQVYHSNIHFRFSPTSSKDETSLTEEEAASLSFTGRSLYFASAHVLKHTLNILFTNTQVNVENIRRERRSNEGKAGGQSLSTNSFRQETIFARIGFSGNLRVTGAEHRYTVLFRYEFDPNSGRIINHFVEKIEPAIGRKLWYGLASVWQKITGQQSHPHPIPSHITGDLGSHDMNILRSVLKGEEKNSK